MNHCYNERYIINIILNIFSTVYERCYVLLIIIHLVRFVRSLSKYLEFTIASGVVYEI